MNCENICFDLALQFGGRFANINDFCKAVINHNNIQEYYELVNLCNSQSITKPTIITNENVLPLLLEEDISHFSIDSYDYIHDNDLNECIIEYVKKIILFYQSIGLDISESDVQIFFCDSFPPPFDKNNGIALAPDAYDEYKFGIKKGIYFLKSNISSYQSRLLVAHEILHHICAKRQPELLARGLEEGLCELLGSFLANSAFFGEKLSGNYIKFRRFKYGKVNQISRLYTDYLRLAYLLLNQVGLNGVVDIINNGRATIKLLETSLIRGDTLSGRPPALLENNIRFNLEKLLLGTIENEVLSPLAFFIIEQYNNENSVSDFAQRHSIALPDCINAFDEIQRRIFGCVTEGDVIEFSDLKQLNNNGNILYECIK